MNIGAYCRVSTKSDEQLTSLENQKAFFEKYAKKNGYEQIEIHNLQVFADTVTLQELAMIPLAELPGNFEQAEVFDTPPQNL